MLVTGSSSLLAPLAASAELKISTSDTTISVEAGANAPRFLRVEGRHGAAWVNRAAEEFVPFVEINDRQLPTTWHLKPNAIHSDPHRLRLVYENASPHLEATWVWYARSDFGPIEHEIKIENLDHQEIWLPLQDSCRFDFALNPRTQIEQLYIEKGAGAPSDVGTHLVPIADGYSWTGTSSTYAHPKPNEPREIIPWSLVEETTTARSGWYVGIEFSGRTRLSIKRSGESLNGAADLNPDPGPFRTRLEPGENFETPLVFVGASHGGPDAAGNILRPWVRKVLGNPETWNNPDYPFTVNNSWGGGMNINEAIAQKMIRSAAGLGLEMFHLDAGWFRGMGDWYPDPSKFPHGLASVADYAHQNGLKFGLWVDWAQAGLDTQPGALSVNDPQVRDWMVTDVPPDWKPEEFRGQTIDLGVPGAKDWAQHEVDRIVTDYHLDMLEHDGYLVAQGCDRTDHPHAPPDNRNKLIYRDSGWYWVDSSNSTDVSYHAVHAYYDIYSKLRESHPGLLLEVCNDGGRMVDFGSADHADYFSITDSYDPVSNRRAFYDASHLLPAAMLETYVEKWPTPRIENFRYMLRSGMMGWFTLMQDTSDWSEEQRNIAKNEIQVYKAKLRPLIRDADLYHISDRPDGEHWDAVEYFNSKREQGAVYAFHGSSSDEPSHAFRLRGIHPQSMYRLHSQDGSSPERSVKGRELLAKGLGFRLPIPNSSELVFFQKIKE